MAPEFFCPMFKRHCICLLKGEKLLKPALDRVLSIGNLWAYLVVHDNMNGAMGGVLWESTQMKCLIHHTLPRKCCITMDENTHHLKEKKNKKLNQIKKVAIMSAFPNTSFSLKTSWISSRPGSPRFNLLSSLVQSQVLCSHHSGLLISWLDLTYLVI